MNTRYSTADATTLQNTSNKFSHSAELAGRILLVAIFLLSGLGKLAAYDQTAGYMDAMGVPGVLLPLVIGFEVIAAIAIIIGWKIRAFSLLLAGFTVLSGAIFHSNFADQIQMILFLKNIAIAGAFLLLFVNGAGKFSLDARKVGVTDKHQS